MKTKCIKKASLLLSIVAMALLLVAYSTVTTEPIESAPQVEGSILINGRSSQEVQLEEGNVVSLFKDFKTGKHSITFSFQGNDLPRDEQERAVVLFEFTTTLYDGKKKLGSSVRRPMPFFPGEMLEPVETFDIINLLTYAQGDPLKKAYPGFLMGSGAYRLVISAKPIGVEGDITSAEIIVSI